MENFYVNGFERNPKLRELLVDYCLQVYNENAIIDDEHLIKEYYWLKENNQLEELFNMEYISNYKFDVTVTRYS